ncbi:hypothetical protein Gain_0077_046 [Komagataeibacter intermedius TF2]|nr:hypothetical protein Gain_0077_046 [Komagataeibacter intermedius TF2]
MGRRDGGAALRACAWGRPGRSPEIWHPDAGDRLMRVEGRLSRPVQAGHLAELFRARGIKNGAMARRAGDSRPQGPAGPWQDGKHGWCQAQASRPVRGMGRW